MRPHVAIVHIFAKLLEVQLGRHRGLEVSKTTDRILMDTPSVWDRYAAKRGSDAATCTKDDVG